MGAPAVFAGRRAKLLTADGIQTSVGRFIDYDGPKNLVTDGKFPGASVGAWTATGCATITNGLPVSVGSGAAAFGSGNGGRAKGANTTSPAIDTSSAITGINAMNLATSGAGTIGDGYISGAYTLEPADKGRVLQWSFQYKVASGTPVQGGTSADTYAVAIYDVANNAWFGSTGTFGITQSSGVGFASGTFQTATTSTSVQIFIYSPVAPAGASSLLFADVVIGPQVKSYGPYIEDLNNLRTFTPSAGFGTVTSKSVWSKRDADRLIVRGSWLAGTVAASTASIGLPVTIDSAKFAATANFQKVGEWTQFTTSASPSVIPSSNLSGDIFYDGSDTANLYFAANVVSSAYQKINANAVWGTGAGISFRFEVPIAGWSSGQLLSSDADTRVVAVSAANKLPTGSIPGSTAGIVAKFGTVDVDTHAAYSTSTGLFTCPVSGWYLTSAMIEVSGTSGAVDQFASVALKKNGTSVAIGAQVTGNASGAINLVVPFTHLLYCNAGDTLGFYVGSSITSPIFGNGLTQSSFSIVRQAGPSQIAASESVNATYGLTSSVTPSANAAIKYDTKIKDTHAAFNVSTGVYTIPAPGNYRLSVVGTVGSGSASIYVFKNSANFSYMATLGTSISSASISVPFNAGDTVAIYSDTSVAFAAIATGYKNYLSIERVGN